MKEVSVHELKHLLDTLAPIQLIDVREPFESEIASIGGELIPMGEVLNRLDEISTSKQVVVYCRSGKRSGTIVTALEQRGFDNVYNLTGGILEYADEIDSSLTKY